MTSRRTGKVAHRRPLPASVLGPSRPAAPAELLEDACVRLVDAVMADDRPAAEVAAAEAVVMLRRVGP